MNSTWLCLGVTVLDGRINSLAVAGLRLAASPDAAGIAGLVLDALVPGFADAAGVYAMERLLRGGPPCRDDRGRTTVRTLGTRFDRPVSPDAFPDGEILVLAPGAPASQCMRSGRPVAYASPGGRVLDQAKPAVRETLSRYSSFLAVPMIGQGAAAGFLTLARAAGAARFGDGDAAAVEILAADAGTGIAAAVAMARHRVIADSLQRGLRGSEPPRPDSLEVAARCLPVNGHVVGGDWYDIVPLPAGRTGIIIGDVMGHGPEAAAVMAQLRAAARALAQLDPQPSELLRQLDRTATTLRDVPLATCAYAVIDPAEASCTLAAAGHLPAVLALPDGSTRTPEPPPGQSLGLSIGTYGQTRTALPPGATLALYTDGLVETRTRSFDEGIAVLRAELAAATGPLDARCDALIQSLAPLPEDDTTLVLARIPDRPISDLPDSGVREWRNGRPNDQQTCHSR